jgi:hypothetical protein
MKEQYILLQGFSKFQMQSKYPVQGIIFILALCLIVGIVIFLNVSKKVKNSKLLKTGAIEKPARNKIAGGGIGAAAKRYSLDNEEKALIMKSCQSSDISPKDVFTSKVSIDESFKQFCKEIRRGEDEDEDEIEANLARLFVIRNRVEYFNEAYGNAQSGNKVPRRSRRSNSSITANYSLVTEEMVKKGLKSVKKLVVDSTKNSGVIVNLSVGGCAIKTTAPLKAGSKIKVEFKIKKASAAVLGKVLRINKGKSESILHVIFLKVLPRASNAINSFVYNYDDF